MRDEKREVRKFYDTFGWTRRRGGSYGESTFNDERAVMVAYNIRSNARVRRALPRTAELFLDAACGARPQSLQWARPSGFERQVCVDMSRTGLSEAREKLGAAGSYVEADLTALPFRDGAFGGFICAHALYHVPADEQEQVVRELFRTLSPGGTGVILYTRPDSPITRAARVYARYRNRLRGTLATRESTSASTEQPAPQPDLYYHPHEYTWWDRLPHEWNVELRPLTSVDREFTTTFIPDNRLGVAMLRVIAFLEERFPRGMVRLGRYPLVILRKPSSI